MNRLLEWIFGPVRSFVEEVAHLEGCRSEAGAENPFTSFGDRRAWREGRGP